MPVISFDRHRIPTDPGYVAAWADLVRTRFGVDPNLVAATGDHCPPTLIVDEVSVTYVFDEYIRDANGQRVVDLERNIVVAEHRQLRSDITDQAPFDAAVYA